MAFFLLIFLVILSFIVIFSVKPRVVFKVNNFLINYLNKYDGLTIDFAKNKSTLSFNKNLGLEYRIIDLKISYNNEINFNIPETKINVDFIKLFIGKIIINNIALSEANLNLRIKENTKREEKNINFQQLIEENIKKISKTPILVKNIGIKNLLINTNINKQNNEINIENFIVKTKLKNKKFHFDEKLIFNVNNSKNIKLDSKCNFKKTLKECNIAINNLNPNDFRNFINEESSIFNYLNNLKAYFDIKSNIFFDNSVIFKSLIAKLFIESMDIDIDENTVITAMLLCGCKKVNNAQDIEKIKSYAKDGAEFLSKLGFSKEFCTICEQQNRYSTNYYIWNINIRNITYI